MTRAVLLLSIIGAAVACSSHPRTVAPVPPTVATLLPQTSASPLPRVTSTRASRTRSSLPRSLQRTAVQPLGSGSLLNWAALRRCESSGNYHDRDSATYRGAYQFDRSTWASVGGSGDPADASPAEQDMRARQLYAARGRQPWPRCGRHL